MKIKSFVIFGLIYLFSIISSAKSASRLPYLEKQRTAHQLIVGDKPFLIIGGELGNSSASSLSYMKDIWPTLLKLNLNSVLIPVYWELIEPVEDEFDFSLVDSLIYQARRNDLKVVFLWFGTWKNSMSCYAPKWVKTD